jgi:hypothetical protein
MSSSNHTQVVVYRRRPVKSINGGLLGFVERHQTGSHRLTSELRRTVSRPLEALDRELDVLIAEHRPMLAVIDRMLSHAALFCHRAGCPVGCC